MNSEVKALKNALRQREAELQKLIRQMKSDNLNTGSLYKNLESELGKIKEKLDAEQEKK